MQLTDRIHLVASGAYGFELTHPSDCHVYLIDGGAEAALIDAGAGLDVAGLTARIGASGVAPERVSRVFVTHAHADHAGGAGPLHETLGLEVCASPEVASILRAGDEVRASVDVGKAQGSYDPSYHYASTVVGRELRDGDRLPVGDLAVEVIETPGHATGHLSFLVHGAGRTDLFTGDTLLFGGEIILQDTWDCDLRTHLDSLRRLGEHRFDGLFPGHLTFSLARGRRHLDRALAAMDRGGIPPLLR